MIRLLLLVLIVCLGIVVGPSLVGHDSYVLIAINGWTIETSIMVMTMIVIAFYAILQFSEWALINTLAMWGRTRHWFGWRKERIAQKKTLDGVLEYAAGHFSQAEQLSMNHIKHSKTPLLNYFTAINAAATQGKKQQRDDYLKQALLTDESNTALLATKLRFMIEDKDFASAEQWLLKQPDKILHHVDILPFSFVIHRHVSDWTRVLKINDLLLKQKLHTPIEHDSSQRHCYIGLFHQASEAGFDSGQKYYKSIPRKYRNHIDIFCEYAKLSIKCDQHHLIEKELFQRLSKHLDSALLTVLNEASTKLTKDWSERLINLNKYQQDVAFIDVITMYYQLDRQWKLAKAWLLTAIELKPTAARFEKLAQIQQELGETSGALESFNRALNYRHS